MEGPSPEAAAAGSEFRRAIIAEISRLAPKLRDTFLLAQGTALNYDEVASMLKVPVGTVKWRISEARRLIRKRLRERGFVDVSE